METIHNLWPLVGIIGGSLPESTNFFTSLLLKLRGEVRRNQRRIPFIPQITDRFERVDFLGKIAWTTFVNNNHLWHFIPPISKF